MNQVSLDTHQWLPIEEARCPDDWKAWLGFAGHLSQRLTEHLQAPCKITWLDEAWGVPDPEEANYLSLPAKEAVWIREVKLQCHDKTCVYARTLFPLAFVQKHKVKIKALQKQLLGQTFFKETIVRSNIEVKTIEPPTHYYQRAIENETISETSLWARRATVLLEEAPFSIMEVFFPHVAES